MAINDVCELSLVVELSRTSSGTTVSVMLVPMVARTPTVLDVARLPRDEWERICASLMALEEGVNRVEDRRGKGNGLDGWKQTDGQIAGYQYRRFDERFGAKQAADLKANVKLAMERAPAELGGALTRFVFFPNIDLEPGHRGSEGELQRFEAVKKWAAISGVTLELRGVTIVHALLCKHPQVKPELFENISAKLDQHDAKLDNQADMLRRLLSSIQTSESSSAAEQRLKKLIKEAELHFERALTLGSEDALSAAVRSIDDAWRLADDDDVSAEFKGKILTVSSAFRMRSGSLQEAKEHALEAARLLGEHADMLARGNLGLIHLEMENYRDAQREFIAILERARQRDDKAETAKALIHLTRVAMGLGDDDAMMKYYQELEEALDALDIRDPDNPGQGNMAHVMVFLYAVGLQGQIYVHVAQSVPVAAPNARRHAMEGFARAEEIFRDLIENAERFDLKELRLVTMSNLAQSVWYQDRLEEAERLFVDVAEAAGHDFVKFRADAFFNLALVQNEQGKMLDRVESMLKAHQIYGEIGDANSLAQAAKYLTEFVRSST